MPGKQLSNCGLLGGSSVRKSFHTSVLSSLSQAQQQMPVIPALGMLRQESSWGMLASKSSQIDFLQTQ